MQSSGKTFETLSEWLEFRQTGIGATDAPVILGLSPWKSALQLYAEKLGLVPVTAVESRYLEWGRRLEPVLAEAYADETQRQVWPNDRPFTVHIHPEFPWMFATIDRWVCAPERFPDRGVGVLELKTAAAFKESEWKEGAPLMYQVQLQHQMAVTGASWGAIAVLIGGNLFLHYDIERDEEFIERLLRAEQTFMDRTARGTPPDPDHSDSAAAALSSLYHCPAAQRIALPAHAVDLDAQRQRGTDLIAEGERLKIEAENKIKAMIQNNVEGILPNGVVYTWKAQERNGKVFRTLRRREP